MGFVLVPVPAEFVYDVMRWVLFQAGGDADSDRARLRAAEDAERVCEVYAESDVPTRRLLLTVANAALRHEALHFRNLADDLERDPVELAAAIENLNGHTFDFGRRVIDKRDEPAVTIDGKPGKAAHVSMRVDLARALRNAAREDDAG